MMLTTMASFLCREVQGPKSTRFFGVAFGFCFFLAVVPLCWAAPSVPNLFSDHMVLEQQQPIHIWGKADPGEQIIVTLEWHSSSTRADELGQWSVKLSAMQAGGPFMLRIRGKKEIVIKDIVIGEVWIASGQSNMTFALSGTEGASEEVPKADYPELRLFTVPKKVARESQMDTLPASWQICTPNTAKEFSAVAYYFARDLHRKLGVPIGIIESAWPGTAIQEWMEPNSLQQLAVADPGYSNDMGWLDAKATGERVPFNLEFDDFELIGDKTNHQTSFSDFDSGSSRNAFGGYWSYDFKNAPDTIYSLVSPGRGSSGYAAQISGAIDASDDSRLVARLHADQAPADLSSYSGISFWVRGNGSFRFRTLQPDVTDWDDYSARLMQASAEWNQVTISFRDLRQEGWGVVKEFTPASLTGFAIECLPASGYPKRPPSGLYQGMIAPLMRYGFRGAIWYQGEGNALDAYHYRELLPALIESWRQASHEEAFPFLSVQLPNHGAIPDEPSESAWAELREAEFMTLKRLPNVGLAVTIDVGDPKDLHPHRKAEVGQRLALWALGTTYKQPIVYSGPLYDSMKIEGNSIRLRFTQVGGGLLANGGGPLEGFAIAGADRKFYWADAAIQGNAVIVSSAQVPQPVAVRYAWNDGPICNLFNKDGLPASPFRTDDWPGITVPKPRAWIFPTVSIPGGSSASKRLQKLSHWR
jgi:sialate O-acetylesterase